MRTNRRSFLRGAIAAASAVSATRVDAGQQHVHPSPPPTPATPSRETPPSRALPGVSRVETPDLPTLGWQMSGGVKEFHLTAAPVRTEFMTGRPVDAWGFNGSMPGPTIEITQGDRVRLFVKNELPEPFSMHWHGLEVPIDMDGTPGISQEAIRARRLVHLRVHDRSARHLLLPLAHGDAGTDGPHRPVHRPATRRRHAAHRPRLRTHLAGLVAASEQHHPEHDGDGVQLADDQRQVRARDDAARRQARRACAHPQREPVDGPSPAAPARQHVSCDGHGSGTDSAERVGAGQHRARRRRPGTRHRVCRLARGRLDAALPSAASHGQQHGGDGGADDARPISDAAAAAGPARRARSRHWSRASRRT